MKDHDIYIMVRYTAKPKDPAKSNVKGYINDPNNITFDEQVSVARGLKNKYLNNQIILNITKQTVVRNIVSETENFNELMFYFTEAYGDYLEESIRTLSSK